MTWIARCTIWGTACGGYLLFAGVVKSRHELITAVVLASGALTWAWMIRHCGRRRFTLSFPHATEWAKAAAALAPAIGRTLLIFARVALFGRSPGRLLEIKFQRGREEGARDSARRASAVLIASLGPDNFVVRAPPKHDCVLMHAILSENASRDPRWLNQ